MICDRYIRITVPLHEGLLVCTRVHVYILPRSQTDLTQPRAYKESQRDLFVWSLGWFQVPYRQILNQRPPKEEYESESGLSISTSDHARFGS